MTANPWHALGCVTRSNKLAADFLWLVQLVTSFRAMGQCLVGKWQAGKEFSVYRVLKDTNMHPARYVIFPMLHCSKEVGSVCNDNYFVLGT